MYHIVIDDNGAATITSDELHKLTNPDEYYLPKVWKYVKRGSVNNDIQQRVTFVMAVIKKLVEGGVWGELLARVEELNMTNAARARYYETSIDRDELVARLQELPKGARLVVQTTGSDAADCSEFFNEKFYRVVTDTERPIFSLCVTETF